MAAPALPAPDDTPDQEGARARARGGHEHFTAITFGRTTDFSVSTLRGSAPAYHLPRWEHLSVEPEPEGTLWPGDEAGIEPDPEPCAGGLLSGRSVTQPDERAGGIAELWPPADKREDTEQPAGDSRADERIVEALQAFYEPLTVEDLSELCELPCELVLGVVRRLRADGLVARQQQAHPHESTYLWRRLSA